MTEKIKIAIIGAGITGICLAHGLRKYPHLDATCYEANSTIREDDGAAVGIGGNGQEALQLISSELRAALDKAGGTTLNPSLRVMISAGKDSGKHVYDVLPKIPRVNVHRGHFVGELMKTIPEESVKTGKKLSNVQQTSDAVILTFEDGAVEHVHGVIACNGINSSARAAVLGPEHPAVKPVYSNRYNHRVIVPLEMTEQVFGKEYCSQIAQYGWVGDDGFLLTDHVDGATAMQIVADEKLEGTWPYESPFVPWPKEKLQESLKSRGEIGKAMTKIFTEQPTLYAAGGRVHPYTPSYCKGNLCIAGDAAQSFPPFQGAGAGMGMEDALILETVLGAISSSSEVAHALSVYEKMSLPRRSRVAELSHEGGLFLTGNSDMGLDIDRMRGYLETWGAEIVDYDLEAARAKTLQLMGKQ